MNLLADESVDKLIPEELESVEVHNQLAHTSLHFH